MTRAPAPASTTKTETTSGSNSAAATPPPPTAAVAAITTTTATVCDGFGSLVVVNSPKSPKKSNYASFNTLTMTNTHTGNSSKSSSGCSNRKTPRGVGRRRVVTDSSLLMMPMNGESGTQAFQNNHHDDNDDDDDDDDYKHDDDDVFIPSKISLEILPVSLSRAVRMMMTILIAMTMMMKIILKRIMQHGLPPQTRAVAVKVKAATNKSCNHQMYRMMIWGTKCITMFLVLVLVLVLIRLRRPCLQKPKTPKRKRLLVVRDIQRVCP